MSGEDLIDYICDKLAAKNIRCTDGNIMKYLRTMRTIKIEED